jgi:hypothetical protein
MPMCKKCKEVVSVTDMQEGFCKNCFTPELLEEEKRRREEEKIERPLLITLISIGGTVLYGILAFMSITGGLASMRGSGFYEMMIPVFLFLVPLISYSALYKMKKWGGYMVILVQISYLVFSVIGITKHYPIYLMFLISVLSIFIIWVVVKNLKRMK